MKHSLTASILVAAIIAAASTVAISAFPSSQQSHRAAGAAGAPGLDEIELEVNTVGRTSRAVAGRSFDLTIEVSGHSPDPVSLVLLNPLPGMVFEPVKDASPPFRSSLRWTVPSPDVVGDEVSLLFQARTEASTSGAAPVGSGSSGTGVFTVDYEVPIRVATDAGAAILTGDVNDDGILDVVGGARFADGDTMANTGAIYVWLGAATPNGQPDATLRVQSAFQGDALGDGAGPAIQLVDVTDDGVLDVVAAAQSADSLNGPVNSGAIYVWRGGQDLLGEVEPSATLTVPTAVDNDQLGELPVLFGDVTGDEITDIVCGSSLADINGVANVGALWVWEGGASLMNSQAPLAQLTVATATAGDRLGLCDGQGVQLVDVNGDTVLDILAGARLADAGGVVNSGAAYLWNGGAQLTSADPDVNYTLSTGGALPNPGDQLGRADGQSIIVADVTGDGRSDVLIGSKLADVDGIVDSGAIYVWAGDEFQDQFPPITTTFRNGSARPGDQLGSGSGFALQVAELTGDAILDVAATASGADDGRGEIYIFEGGPFLPVSTDPIATLTHDGGRDAGMGDASGQAVALADITGDGRLDVIAAAPLADVNGVTDTGALYFWSGELGFLGGAQGQSVTFNNAGAPGDRLGSFSGPSVTIADVTGDSFLDVVSGASRADHQGVSDTGAFYVWSGGQQNPSDVPDATLTVPLAMPGDRLGDNNGLALRIADVSDDDLPDLVITASRADGIGAVDAGAIYIFQGGPVLSGPVAPWTTLTDPLAADGDRLGDTGGRGVIFADISGNGRRDIIVGARYSDRSGIENAGAVLAWESGTQLPFSGAVPTAELIAPNPQINDQLSFATVHMTAADITDDGILDLVVGAQNADLGAVENTGAIFVWQGGNSFTSTPAPTPTTLSNAQARAGDSLGG